MAHSDFTQKMRWAETSFQAGEYNSCLKLLDGIERDFSGDKSPVRNGLVTFLKIHCLHALGNEQEALHLLDDPPLEGVAYSPKHWGILNELAVTIADGFQDSAAVLKYGKRCLEARVHAGNIKGQISICRKVIEYAVRSDFSGATPLNPEAFCQHLLRYAIEVGDVEVLPLVGSGLLTVYRQQQTPGPLLAALLANSALAESPLAKASEGAEVLVSAQRELPLPLATKDSRQLPFELICKAGAEASSLLRGEANFELALQRSENILALMSFCGIVDSFLCAKAVLNILVAELSRGRYQTAFAIWRSAEAESETESFYRLGMLGIESGGVGEADIMLYLLISANLQARSGQPPDHSKAAVDMMLGRVLEYATTSDQALMPVVLQHWQANYTLIHEDGEIPGPWRTELKDRQKQLGVIVFDPAAPFPPGGPWEVTWDQGQATLVKPDGDTAQVDPGQYQSDGKPAVSDEKNWLSRLWQKLIGTP